jgi:hypothetical protein
MIFSDPRRQAQTNEKGGLKPPFSPHELPLRAMLASRSALEARAYQGATP